MVQSIGSPEYRSWVDEFIALVQEDAHNQIKSHMQGSRGLSES